MSSQVFDAGRSPRYWIIFAVLAIFTALEVATAYLTSLPFGIKVAILAFLAIVKIALVLLYFMRLRYDERLFALPFALGIVLAVPVMLIVSLTMNLAPINAEASAVNETGQVIDVKEVSFQIQMSQTSANAGQVTFHIVNGADDMLHEFIIFQTDLPASELPTDMMGRVEEDAMTIVAAAEDIPPANSRDLTVNLGEGHYVMICNLPGHFLQGMRIDFTVTGSSNLPTTVPESTAAPTSPSGTEAPGG